MSYMKDADGNRLDELQVKARLDGLEQVSDLITGQFPTPDQRRLIGPVATDLPTVNLNIAGSGIYNQAYAISGNTIPAGFPVDYGKAPAVVAGNFIGYTTGLQTRTYRFMTDALRVAILMNSGASGQSVWGDFFLFVDGAPVSLAAYDPATSTTTFTELIFASAKPRLIEIMTSAGLSAVYCPQPYRCWLPPVAPGVTAMIIGDSYSGGITAVGGTTGAPTYGDNLNGFSSKLGLEIGLNSRWSQDAKGSTGYIKESAGGAGDNYAGRLASHIARNCDVYIVGGGGSNDLFAGNSVASIIAAATSYFTNLRAGRPNAKLIFMEGFAPPNGFSTFNDEYTAIRVALQAALVSVGVYYIDIATSSAWISGTGWVGATSGSGNSDIYTGNDGIHPSLAGHPYILKRLAPKIRAAIADDGPLLNTLI